MIAADGAWALPGPARLLGDLCDALYRERALVVRAPTAPAGLAAAVERRLNDDGQARVVPLQLEPGRPALDQIAAQAGARGGGAAALVTDPMLAGCAVVIDGVGPVDRALDDAFRLAARSRAGATPLLLAVGAGDAPPLGPHPARDLRDAVEPLDSAARLASLLFALPPFERRLVASVVAEVAGWDVALLDRLAALPIADTVRPDRCVARWSDPRREDWARTPAGWTAGSLDGWGGEPREHPLWLAANRPEGLTKQVWRGQVAALLPWIETRRLEIVAVFRQVLRPDADRSGAQLEALDWGPLRVQLGRQDRRFLEMVEAMRDARNALAHGRPLDWGQISGCLEAGRRWAGGRGAPAVRR